MQKSPKSLNRFIFLIFIAFYQSTVGFGNDSSDENIIFLEKKVREIIPAYRFDRIQKSPIIKINNDNYYDELKLLEQKIKQDKKCKCTMLVVDKEKSFDKNLKGDFNLIKDLITKNVEKKHQLIYTGMQIIDPKVFMDYKEKVFSINNIWDQLIKEEKLFGVKSKNEFYHISTLNIYENLKKKFNY